MTHQENDLAASSSSTHTHGSYKNSAPDPFAGIASSRAPISIPRQDSEGNGVGDGNSGEKTGIIVGCVVGSIVLVLVLGYCFFLCSRERQGQGRRR